MVNLVETEAQDTGSDGTDRLTEIHNLLGSRFNDVLTGSSRVNVVAGDEGDDLLTGRADNDIKEHNRTYVLSDTVNGGAGNDTADYRHGDPAEVAAAVADLQFAPCADDPASTCGTLENDGENGTDELVNIENIRKLDDDLLLTGPNKKIIAPDQAVRLDFYVTGGDGRYQASFAPTGTTRSRTDADGKTLPSTKIAVLAAPADQANPVSPFPADEDLPDYKAVRTLEGTPSGNGTWRFTVYAKPLVTTTFRITVVDMVGSSEDADAPGHRQTSVTAQIVVTNPLEVTIDQAEYVLSSGQAVQLRGAIAGGTPPYKIAWEASDGSQATTLSATDILIPVADPTKTTVYTLRVQDTSPDSLDQEAEAETKVTVVSDGTKGPGDTGGDTTGGDTTGGDTTGGDTTDGDNTGGEGNDNTGGDGDGENTPNEVTGQEGDTTAPVTPMCGFGVTSWVMMGNLLALAVMKRRRG